MKYLILLISLFLLTACTNAKAECKKQAIESAIVSYTQGSTFNPDVETRTRQEEELANKLYKNCLMQKGIDVGEAERITITR